MNALSSRQISDTAALGTVRSNLDPFSLYDDPRLWDSLRRSFLVDAGDEESSTDTDSTMASDSGQCTPTSRINLDLVLDSEGANLSVGQRCLLSLARALVKDSRVVVLDEATYVRR
jgi:ABC-type multidrug transport system fused ATPase/permease subunit